MKPRQEAEAKVQEPSNPWRSGAAMDVLGHAAAADRGVGMPILGFQAKPIRAIASSRS